MHISYIIIIHYIITINKNLLFYLIQITAKTQYSDIAIPTSLGATFALLLFFPRFSSLLNSSKRSQNIFGDAPVKREICPCGRFCCLLFVSRVLCPGETFITEMPFSEIFLIPRRAPL